MRAVLTALVLLAACGGNVVVDPTTATSGGVGGSAPDAGSGGSPDAGQVVDCAGTMCMPGQICCSPAGPALVCYTGTGCPP